MDGHCLCTGKSKRRIRSLVGGAFDGRPQPHNRGSRPHLRAREPVPLLPVEQASLKTRGGRDQARRYRAMASSTWLLPSRYDGSQKEAGRVRCRRNLLPASGARIPWGSAGSSAFRQNPTTRVRGQVSKDRLRTGRRAAAMPAAIPIGRSEFARKPWQTLCVQPYRSRGRQCDKPQSNSTLERGGVKEWSKGVRGLMKVIAAHRTCRCHPIHQRTLTCRVFPFLMACGGSI